MQVGRKELLWYVAPPTVHAALLRGTTADLDGNISFEKEALYLDSLNMVRCRILFMRLPSVNDVFLGTLYLLLPTSTVPASCTNLE